MAHIVPAKHQHVSIVIVHWMHFSIVPQLKISQNVIWFVNLTAIKLPLNMKNDQWKLQKTYRSRMKTAESELCGSSLRMDTWKWGCPMVTARRCLEWGFPVTHSAFHLLLCWKVSASVMKGRCWAGRWLHCFWLFEEDWGGILSLEMSIKGFEITDRWVRKQCLGVYWHPHWV